MSNTTELKKLAKSFDAEVSINPIGETTDIQVAAPDGKQWWESQSIHLVAEYCPHIKGDKEKAIIDLLSRMAGGLEPRDYSINP